jgi:hypothetical protein
VAPGAVVVLGIPGLHADDVKRLDHVRSKVADVAVVLKGLDSSIRMGDLEQYRDYLDLPADLVTVTACDEDERQIELLRGFLEDMRVADWDERLKAERNELETAVADAAARTGNVRPFDPTELKLRDLPDVVARALNEVSTKSHEQRTRERDAAAAAECRRQYDSQVSAWEMQVREAKLACNGQWARVGTRQRQIKALDEKTGCGMWMLLLASFALFPFGPVIWVVVRIVMSVKADERKAAQLPSQQYQLDIEMRELHRCQQVVAKLESQRPVLK